MSFQELMNKENEAVKDLRECGKCSHVNVCSIFRAVAPLMNSFEVRKPFEAKELAKICKEFTLTVMTPKEVNNARKLSKSKNYYEG